MSDRTLNRLQAGSGVVFALFLTLHLLTTVSAAWGGAAYDGTIATLRRAYRPNLVVEGLLVALPAALHFACAIWKILRRRRRGAGSPGWRVRLHRYTGYYLLLAIAGHAFATRVLPTFSTAATATGAADLSFLAFSILNWPYFFIPYYIGLGASGAIHLTLGFGQAIKTLAPRQINGPVAARVAVVAAILLGIAVTAGVGGIIVYSPTAPRARFPEDRELYRRYAPFLHPTIVE